MSSKKRNNRKDIKSPNSLWLYGKHPVIAALKNKRRQIKKILITENVKKELSQNIAGLESIIEIVRPSEIDKFLPEGAVHQGIACEASPLDDVALEEIIESNTLIMLDQVTDPHNVGAVLRSAAAFGAGAVILPYDNSPSQSTIMAKSASGAMEIVPLVKVNNLASTMDYLKKQNYWLIGLDGDAKTNIGEIPAYEKIVLVLGAEGKGLRRLTSDKCDLLVKIPMTGAVESLNVSNAAAVALYELSDAK